MKLQAKVGDQTHQLDITQDGDRIRARVDGREYDLEALEVEPNVYLMRTDGMVREVFVARADNKYHASINGHDIEIDLIDPRKLRSFGSGSGEAEGMAEVRTMMPGKVVRFVIKPGDPVEKGDGVIVVEAMKMQNELKAPKAGTLKEFRVSEGDTVGAGDVLAIIE